MLLWFSKLDTRKESHMQILRKAVPKGTLQFPSDSHMYTKQGRPIKNSKLKGAGNRRNIIYYILQQENVNHDKIEQVVPEINTPVKWGNNKPLWIATIKIG